MRAFPELFHEVGTKVTRDRVLCVHRVLFKNIFIKHLHTFSGVLQVELHSRSTGAAPPPGLGRGPSCAASASCSVCAHVVCGSTLHMRARGAVAMMQALKPMAGGVREFLHAVPRVDEILSAEPSESERPAPRACYTVQAASIIIWTGCLSRRRRWTPPPHTHQR